MTGPFIELTEAHSGRAMLVNADLVICIAPHGRVGSYIYFMGDTDRIEADETPDEVAALLQAADVVCQRHEA